MTRENIPFVLILALAIVLSAPLMSAASPRSAGVVQGAHEGAEFNAAADSISPPAGLAKLIFIHHSGAFNNWLVNDWLDGYPPWRLFAPRLE